MWNNPQGEFVRYVSLFRDHIQSGAGSRFEPQASRYHLYISWACPWAHRTAIVRGLLGLEDVISLSVVDPVWNENGWTFTDFEGCIADFVNHQKDLIDIYRLADPEYAAEETTPVLWDKKHQTIVNNESLDIIKMFATEFLPLAKNKSDLYPEGQREEIDRVVESIYPKINNGVYRAGFATSQRAYDRAIGDLFGALDWWEFELGKHRYLLGDRMTLADICMFTTLFRFDLVYYGHFKCNLRHIYEYPNLWGFVRDIYQTPGVSETCRPEHIKRHYYISQKEINPTQIVPAGPNLDFSHPHERDAARPRPIRAASASL
ncbi:MAG TPA: glutathione S-transferase family protein [Bdellovibrionota bacterium]|nr:glutathione S-transferase family protein [Bdellovibrionota bacterium]